MDDAPWADEEAYLLADMQKQAPAEPSSPTPTTSPADHSEAVSDSVAANKHGAAMELAPSKEPLATIQDEPLATEAGEPKSAADEDPGNQQENIRVRILETLPEPVMDASGQPLTLEAGDVHFLDEGTATWLTDAGVAERAEL